MSPERAFRFIIVRVFVVFDPEPVAVWYNEFAIVASDKVLRRCVLPVACYWSICARFAGVISMLISA